MSFMICFCKLIWYPYLFLLFYYGLHGLLLIFKSVFLYIICLFRAAEVYLCCRMYDYVRHAHSFSILLLFFEHSLLSTYLFYQLIHIFLVYFICLTISLVMLPGPVIFSTFYYLIEILLWLVICFIFYINYHTNMYACSGKLSCGNTIHTTAKCVKAQSRG